MSTTMTPEQTRKTETMISTLRHSDALWGDCPHRSNHATRLILRAKERMRPIYRKRYATHNRRIPSHLCQTD